MKKHELALTLAFVSAVSALCLKIMQYASKRIEQAKD